MESMRERNCRSQVNRAVEFFRKLPSSALEDFRLLEHQSSYAANVVLFAEGEPVRALFAILEGEVRLSINSSEGKRLILRIAREGDIIGLSSTLSGTPYDMTAETLYSSKIAPIERREFLNFLARHPDAYQSVTDELGRHMTMACSQLRTIVVSIQRDGASRTAALELPKLEHRRYSAPLHRKPESFHRKSHPYRAASTAETFRWMYPTAFGVALVVLGARRSMDHNGCSVLAATGVAQHNLDRQNDAVSGPRQLTACDAIEEQICGNPADLLRRLPNYRECRRGEIGELEVVKSDQGNIVRDFHSQVQKRGKHVACCQGVRGKEGRSRIRSL